MSTAVPLLPDVQDSTRCLEGALRASLLLADDFGVTVRYTDLDPLDGGDFDGKTRTMRISRYLDIEDRTFLLSELWRLLSIGIHATQAIPITAPGLRLVPSPRTP